MGYYITDATSKITNNPLATIGGGFATYYLLKKYLKNSPIVTNKYFFIGSIIVGGFLGASISNSYKQSRL